MKLNIGIIGAGLRGFFLVERLVKNFSDKVEISGLCDIDKNRLEFVKKVFGLSREQCFLNYEKLIKKKNLDAVIIATPDYTHADIAVKSFLYNKHILCEKPIATNYKDCLRILDAKKKSGKILQMGLVLRYSPLVQKTKELIQNNKIGDVKLINQLNFYYGGRTYFRRWNRFKKNTGGFGVHKSCHDFDLLNYFINSYPKRVSCFGSVNVFTPNKKFGQRCSSCLISRKCPDNAYTFPIGAGHINSPEGKKYAKEYRKNYVDDVCLYNSEKDSTDHFVTIVEYENGAKANHTTCLYSSRTFQRFFIVGDCGEIEVDSAERDIKLFPLHTKEKFHYELNKNSVGYSGGDDPEISSFLECVKTGKKPLADEECGRLSLLIGLAAEKSLNEKRIVEIKEIV
ncbi:MAG: hypothetical protein A2539_10450 [Elusimicrobia bacterium RIFOXYD2_FULL_34_15]|nr:MAG: hypothetical protein A2539_10450 [Elusimicrobia bacterium RIFOXYD2_FULL_34_15]